MDTIPNREVREAVIKLEAKMEQMSGAIASMAISVEKLADIKYEIKETKKDCDTNYQKCRDDQNLLVRDFSELRKSQDSLSNKVGEIEDKTSRNSWFVGNAERLGWILITGFVGLLYYVIKGSSIVFK